MDPKTLTPGTKVKVIKLLLGEELKSYDFYYKARELNFEGEIINGREVDGKVAYLVGHRASQVIGIYFTEELEKLPPFKIKKPLFKIVKPQFKIGKTIIP